MANSAKRQRRLRDAYAFPGFRPQGTVRGVRIATRLIRDPAFRGRTINVGLRRYSALEFVQAMERAVGLSARSTVVERGQPFELRCPEVAAIADKPGLDCGEGYLDRVLRKYFGR